MKKAIAYSGAMMLLLALITPPVAAISLYSTLTETLYMDCVQHISGTGPVYRLDLKFTTAVTESSDAVTRDNQPVQVLIPVKLVQSDRTDLCQLGVDPTFQFDNDEILISTHQTDVIGNLGELLGVANIDLSTGSHPGVRITNASVLTADRIVPENRPRVVTDAFNPDVQHETFRSFIAFCMRFLPFSSGFTETLEMILAVTKGDPMPETVISQARVMVSNVGNSYLSTTTEINEFGQYNGIPVIGEIPGLGWLFKSDRNNSVKNALLIIVTAQTVTCERSEP